MTGELEATVQRLVDRGAIHDLLMTYFRAVDRVDLELLRSCYQPDATDSHGSFTGGVDAYLAWVEPLLRSYDKTFHLAGNVLIEFEGSRIAHSETYGVAYHRTAGGKVSQNLITGFRFVDRFERRGTGPWLIARRLALTEWVSVDGEENWFRFPHSFPSGSRDRSDPVYRGATL